MATAPSSQQEIKPEPYFAGSASPLGLTFQLIRQNLSPCQEPIQNIYKVGKVIGGGQFGTVSIGERKIESSSKDGRQVSKQKFAIKSIQKDGLKESHALFMNQLAILKTMDHPNIVKLYQVYQDEEYFYLVCEFCSGGQLFDRILEKGKFSQQNAAKVMHKILSALNYMHQAGVCHRDLKPQNFMFGSVSRHAEIKIIDFGLSKYINDGEKLETIVGTPYYVAPQVLTGKYDKSCDMWSVGVLLYILLCGYPPFTGRTSKEIFKNIMEVNYDFPQQDWNQISQSAKHLISGLLHPRTDFRFRAETALQHQWFALHQSQNQITRNKLNKKLDINVLKRLKRFSAPFKLQRQILNFVVQTCKDQEIAQLREAFRAIDIDNSGYIEVEELKRAFREAGLNYYENEIEEIMKKVDTDGNGIINYSQFISATLDYRTALDHEKLWYIFKHFDTSGDGKISRDDLIQAFRREGRVVQESQIEQMLHEHFRRKSGKGKLIGIGGSKQQLIPHSLSAKSGLNIVEQTKLAANQQPKITINNQRMMKQANDIPTKLSDFIQSGSSFQELQLAKSNQERAKTLGSKQLSSIFEEAQSSDNLAKKSDDDDEQKQDSKIIQSKTEPYLNIPSQIIVGNGSIQQSTGHESDRSASSTQSGSARGALLERQITFRDFCSILNSIGANSKGLKGSLCETTSSGGGGERLATGSINSVESESSCNEMTQVSSTATLLPKA